MKLSIFFLKLTSFYILKNKNYYYFYFIKNNKKFFLFFISDIYVSKELKYIIINHKNLLNLSYVNNFIKLLDNFFFKKIKIRHKISWLKLFRKKFFLIKINYGFSYNVYFFINNLYFRKKKKYLKFSNFLFWGLNKSNLFNVCLNIRNLQYINQYTIRGFKFSQQKFLKRVGKISKFAEFKKKIF